MHTLPMEMPKGAKIAEYLRRAAVARESAADAAIEEWYDRFIINARERIAAARAARITNGLYNLG